VDRNEDGRHFQGAVFWWVLRLVKLHPIKLLALRAERGDVEVCEPRPRFARVCPFRDPPGCDEPIGLARLTFDERMPSLGLGDVCSPETDLCDEGFSVSAPSLLGNGFVCCSVTHHGICILRFPSSILVIVRA
jgi:hypothetical protein